MDSSMPRKHSGPTSSRIAAEQVILLQSPSVRRGTMQLINSGADNLLRKNIRCSRQNPYRKAGGVGQWGSALMRVEVAKSEWLASSTNETTKPEKVWPICTAFCTETGIAYFVRATLLPASASCEGRDRHRACAAWRTRR